MAETKASAMRCRKCLQIIMTAPAAHKCDEHDGPFTTQVVEWDSETFGMPRTFKCLMCDTKAPARCFARDGRKFRHLTVYCHPDSSSAGAAAAAAAPPAPAPAQDPTPPAAAASASSSVVLEEIDVDEVPKAPRPP